MEYMSWLIVLVGICIHVTVGQDTDLDNIIDQAIQDAIASDGGSGSPFFGAVARQNSGAESVKVLPPASGKPLSSNNPQERLNLLSGQTEDPEASLVIGIGANLIRTATKNAVQSSGQPMSAILPQLNEGLTRNCDQILPPSPVCNFSEPYRRIDGSCNNIHPGVIRGKANTPQTRLIATEYDDDLQDKPRSRGKNGDELPNPRLVSNVVFATTQTLVSPPESQKHTLTLVHFAQFVDHDIIKTPAVKEIKTDGVQPYEVPIEDCDKHCVVPKFGCFPFTIPDDNFNTKCMHFVRSKPAVNPDCRTGPRQQVNERTSFLDLSAAYGSSTSRERDLRGNPSTGGLLNVSAGNLPPFGPDVSDCLRDKQPCFNSGDDRVQEIPMLSVIHTVFIREHNSIASQLSQINPHWNDEKLYQETKKILTGIYQHIVFNEFLPLILGYFTTHYSGLLSTPFGHAYSYNPYIDPSTINEFGVAAYRFGHSLVGLNVSSMDPNFDLRATEEMRYDFFDNSKIRDFTEYGPERMGRWMANKLMGKRDRFISSQIRNHLFENPETFDSTGKSDGFDLAAFNIQRGRDHGVPGYNKFRQFCGKFPAKSFKTGYFGFRDHDADTVAKLKQVYSHPDDVDLFVGGISEKPNVHGDILGPTFKCLVALQFQRYKRGDRFFYENPFPNTGFTKAQVNDIKKQTFAGLYCRALQLAKIQPKVFQIPSYLNQRVNCDSLPKPNLYLWKDH